MIKIDVSILIQFVNFIILMVALNILLYRPLRKVMRQRRESISGAFQSAQNLEGQIEEKMNRYQQQLEEAKARGHHERTGMRKAAAEEEARILGAAHDVATGRVKAVQEQVAKEAASARAALKAETNTIAEQIATKVLGRKLS